MRLPLCIMVLLVLVLPVQGQETFTWEPHDFTVTVPEGWQVRESGVEDILLTNDANDATVRVTWKPSMAYSGITIEDFTPYASPDAESIIIGDETYDVLTDIPVIGGRQVMLINIADTYLMTASAPADMWDDFYPTLEAIITSIEASPNNDPLLTQPIHWRDISLMTPADWRIFDAGRPDIYVLSSRETRLAFAATFQMQQLSMDVRDVSFLRDVLDADSLRVLRAAFFIGSRYEIGPVETMEQDGIKIYGADFSGDIGQGRVMLFVSPDFAYLVAGMSIPEAWEASERDLFVAIIETMQFE